ncbi:hypothetical protein RDABS01_005256 [Bienertia sinuspersici]
MLIPYLARCVFYSPIIL